MEATRVYHENLCYFLRQCGQKELVGIKLTQKTRSYRSYEKVISISLYIIKNITQIINGAYFLHKKL